MDTRSQWEELAASWDRARRHAWPEVAAFAESFPPGARLLDLAAGNGRHTVGASKAGARIAAADFSRSLLGFARERGLECVQADARALPFREAAFDGALFVAALHCIPSRTGRLGALADLRRALKPGGRALVTVWSRFRTGSLRTAWEREANVPWGDSPRFYHFYGPVELATDARAAGFSEVRVRGARMSRQARWLPDNWLVELRA